MKRSALIRKTELRSISRPRPKPHKDPVTRPCAVGHEGVQTTLYIQEMGGVTVTYVALCRAHAKSRRSLGYKLTPARRTKGTY